MLAWVYIGSKGGPIFNYDPHGWGVSLWVNSKHFLAAKFIEGDNGCTTCFVSALPLKTNEWSYVGMSYDRTSGIAKLWVNGRVSSQRDIGTTIRDLSTSRSARMGARATRDGNYFKGRISRMQVYDRALTQREVEVVAGPIAGKVYLFSVFPGPSVCSPVQAASVCLSVCLSVLLSFVRQFWLNSSFPSFLFTHFRFPTE